MPAAFLAVLVDGLTLAALLPGRRPARTLRSHGRKDLASVDRVTKQPRQKMAECYMLDSPMRVVKNFPEAELGSTKYPESVEAGTAVRSGRSLRCRTRLLSS